MGKGIRFMIVAEIQEYIDNSIQESEQVGMSGYDSALYLKNSMRTVRSMLDELETKAKWEEQEYYKGYTAHQKANICSKCGFETVEKTKYCSNCGAIMNDELQSEDAELKNIKPLLLFSERKQVADEYEKWLLKTNAQDIGVNFVSYLLSQGWLDNEQILKDLRRNQL